MCKERRRYWVEKDSFNFGAKFYFLAKLCLLVIGNKHPFAKG